MLFPGRLHDGIEDGSVTVAFRRWRRPSVTTGGTLRTSLGVLAIDEVRRIDRDAITDEDARRAGEPDRQAVLDQLDARAEGELYRIAFHRQGDDPRLALRDQVPTGEELDAVLAQLDRIDRTSRRGPWTDGVLAAIAARPEVAAGHLADDVGRERLAFKRDVRRLKDLGLTISCGTGYRLSPRGAAVLAARRG